MDYTKENAARLIDRIKKSSRGFRMNFLWAKPGKYRIRKQRTLEEFEHEWERSPWGKNQGEKRR